MQLAQQPRQQVHRVCLRAHVEPLLGGRADLQNELLRTHDALEVVGRPELAHDFAKTVDEGRLAVGVVGWSGGEVGWDGGDKG